MRGGSSCNAHDARVAFTAVQPPDYTTHTHTNNRLFLNQRSRQILPAHRLEPPSPSELIPEKPPSAPNGITNPRNLPQSHPRPADANIRRVPHRPANLIRPFRNPHLRFQDQRAPPSLPPGESSPERSNIREQDARNDRSEGLM